MAEKEERILHIVQKLDGRFVGENRITRTEAIERMAKALIDIALTGHYSRFEDSCVVEDSIPYAEAALNALLEGK